MPLRSLPLAAVPALLAALAATGAGAAEVLLQLDDPAGDADGPGTYQPPTSGEFTDGDFDLQRFTVRLDGDEVVFEVTLGAPIRRPEVAQRNGGSEVPLWNGIYLQNIDLYLDTDPASTAGRADGLPGRRIAFADGRTWKRAVVLTPQPGLTLSLLETAWGRDATRVLAPAVQSRGRTLIARVSVLALGGVPKRTWGWSVQLTGARWDRSFALLDRLRGTREVDAFTMPVLTVPDSWAFGGALAGEAHTRVIDLILPPGTDQRRVLASSDVETGAFARVPFVYPEPPPPPPPPQPPSQPPPQPLPQSPSPSQTRPPSRPLTLTPPPQQTHTPAPAPGLTVTDLSDNLISISGPVAGLHPMQFGQVLGDDGRPVSHLIITQVLENGLLARPLASREKIVRGARVVFDAEKK